MADAYSLKAVITADSSGFKKGVKTAQSSIKALSGAVSVATKALVGLFAVKGISDFTKSIGKMASSFNDASSEIVKGTGATGKALEDLQKSVSDSLLNGVGRATKEIGSMVADLNTRFGVTGDELTHLVDEFDMLSSVTGVDTKNAISSVADVMNKWDVSLDQTDLLLDQLVKASQESGASIEELTDGLKSGQAVFSQFGMGVTKSTAFLATLKKSGVDTSTVMTGMRTALIKFSKEGKNAGKGFTKVTKQIQNARTETQALKIATDVFGARSAPEMVRVLRNAGTSADEMAEKLKGSAGALKRTEQASRTTRDAIDDLKAILTSFFASFSNDHSLRDMIDEISSAVGKLNTDELQNGIKKFKEGLKTMLSYTAAILVNIYDNFKIIFEDIKKLLSDSGISFKDFRENIYKVFNDVYKTFQSVIGLLDALMHGDWEMVWEYAKLAVLNTVKSILDSFDVTQKSFGKFIIGTLNIAQTVSGAFGSFGATIKTALEGVEALMKNSGDLAKGTETKIQNVQQNIDRLSKNRNYEPIKPKDLSEIATGLNKLNGKFKDHGNVITEVSEETSDAIQQEGKEIEDSTNRIGSYYEELKRKIKEFISDMLSKVMTPVKNFISNSLTTVLNWIPDSVKTVGSNVISVIGGICGDINKVVVKAVKGFSEILISGVKIAVNAFKTGAKVISSVTQAVVKVVSGTFNAIKTVISFNISDTLDVILKFEDAVLTFFVETLPKLPDFLKSVLSSISNLLNTLVQNINVDQIAKFVSKMVQILIEELPGIISNLITIGMALIEGISKGITENLPELLTTVTNVIVNIITTLTEALPNIFSTLLTIGTQIIENLDTILQSLIEFLSVALQEGIPVVIQLLFDFIAVILKNLPSIISVIIEAIPTLVTSILEEIPKFFTEDFPTIFAEFMKLIPTLIKVIVDIAVEIVKHLPEIVVSIIQGLVKAFSEVDWWDLIKSIFQAFIDGFKKLFGIHSPSTFFEEMGGFMVEGLLNGLKGVGEAMLNIFKTAFEGLKSFFSGICDWFSNAFEAVGSGIKSGWESVKGFVSEAGSAIGNVASNVWEGTKNVATKVGSGIATGAKAVGSAVAKGAKAVWGKITSWFADGTNAAPRGLAVVGEAGPELVNFKGGEKVYNATNTAKMLEGSKGGSVFNVTFNNTQDTTAFAMMSQLQRYQRNLAFNGVL